METNINGVPKMCTTGNTNYLNKSNLSRELKILYASAQIVGITFIVLIFHWCVFYNGGFQLSGHSLFSLHPVFMVTGLIYCTGNAIVTFRVFCTMKKKYLKLVHVIMNCSGLVCAALGILSIYNYLIEEKAPNLFTIHSWVGALTIFIYCSQAIGGLYAFVFRFISDARKRCYLPFHKQIGNFVFILGVGTAMIGLNEKALWSLGNSYKLRVPAAWVINCAGTLMVVFAGLIYFINSSPKYERKPYFKNVRSVEHEISV